MPLCTMWLFDWLATPKVWEVPKYLILGEYYFVWDIASQSTK